MVRMWAVWMVVAMMGVAVGCTALSKTHSTRTRTLKTRVETGEMKPAGFNAQLYPTSTPPGWRIAIRIQGECTYREIKEIVDESVSREEFDLGRAAIDAALASLSLTVGLVALEEAGDLEDRQDEAREAIAGVTDENGNQITVDTSGLDDAITRNQALAGVGIAVAGALVVDIVASGAAAGGERVTSRTRREEVSPWRTKPCADEPAASKRFTITYGGKVVHEGVTDDKGGAFVDMKTLPARAGAVIEVIEEKP